MAQLKPHKKNYINEAVGVFADEQQLRDAINDLQSSGFAQHELSVPGNEDIYNRRNVKEIEDDPKIARTIYIPREAYGEVEAILMSLPFYIIVAITAASTAAMGGSILSVVSFSLVMAVACAIAGYMVFNRLMRPHELYMLHQKDIGGYVLWVNTRNKTMQKKAMQILSEHKAKDVHIHSIPLHH